MWRNPRVPTTVPWREGPACQSVGPFPGNRRFWKILKNRPFLEQFLVLKPRPSQPRVLRASFPLGLAACSVIWPPHQLGLQVFVFVCQSPAWHVGEARVRNECRAEFNSDPSKFQVLIQGAWARVGVVVEPGGSWVRLTCMMRAGWGKVGD